MRQKFKFVGILLAVFMVMAAVPSMALAAPASGPGFTLAQTSLISGGPIGAGIAIIGAGIGIGRIGASACEASARQPSMQPKIFTTMIVSAALIEGAAFFALIICLL